MTWPVLLSTSTCLLPVATRFGVLLLNGRRLFPDWMADCDNKGWCEDAACDENTVRLKAAWNPAAVALTGLKWLGMEAAVVTDVHAWNPAAVALTGLNRLGIGAVATDDHEGWELSRPAMLTAADAGLTGWLLVSGACGSKRSTWTGGWLDTTAGCELTTRGDAGRLVETLLLSNSDRCVDDTFTDDTTSLRDDAVVTDVSIVFFRAISSSNFNTA